MTETTEATGRDSLGGTTSPLLGPIRIGIGLLQGLGLYWLQRSADNDLKVWPATEPLLFGPLLLVVASCRWFCWPGSAGCGPPPWRSGPPSQASPWPCWACMTSPARAPRPWTIRSICLRP